MVPIGEERAAAIERELEVLIPARDIARRVSELAAEIESSLAGERVVAVSALIGGFVFLSDLIRQIRPAPTVDLAHLRSYGSGTRSSDQITLLRPLDQSIRGRHVLIVEDIVDTGQTARFLIDMVRAEGPAAMTFVTLLNKQARRKVHIEPDLVGFEVADRFVVGYGLDYAGLFRSLPDVCALPRWAEDAWPEGTPPGERRT